MRLFNSPMTRARLIARGQPLSKGVFWKRHFGSTQQVIIQAILAKGVLGVAKEVSWALRGLNYSYDVIDTLRCERKDDRKSGRRTSFGGDILAQGQAIKERGMGFAFADDHCGATAPAASGQDSVRHAGGNASLPVVAPSGTGVSTRCTSHQSAARPP